MTRKPLPHRRPCITRLVRWDGHEFSVSIGYNPKSGKPAEVFADTSKGGQMQLAIADACVLVSVALQHGIGPEDLAKSLGRVPVFTGEEGATGPASPIGAVVEAIVSEGAE